MKHKLSSAGHCQVELFNPVLCPSVSIMTDREPILETQYMPIYITSGIFGTFFFLGMIAPRGPNAGVIRTSIMLSAICMWLFWLIVYVAQMNPILGPAIPNTTLLWMSRKWGLELDFQTGQLKTGLRTESRPYTDTGRRIVPGYYEQPPSPAETLTDTESEIDTDPKFDIETEIVPVADIEPKPRTNIGTEAMFIDDEELRPRSQTATKTVYGDMKNRLTGSENVLTDDEERKQRTETRLRTVPGDNMELSQRPETDVEPANVTKTDFEL